MLYASTNWITSAQAAAMYGMPEPEPLELKQEIVAEPIEAWRVWLCRRDQQVTLDAETLERLAVAHDEGRNPFRGLLRTKLLAVAQGTIWQKVTKASCLSSEHDAPHSGCSCGLWALHKEEDAWQTVSDYEHFGSDAHAFGRVKLWGRIVEHERGFRAQYASPVSVTLLSDDAQLGDELAAEYGVPVSLAPDHEGVVAAKERRNEAWALPTSPGLPPSTAYWKAKMIAQSYGASPFRVARPPKKPKKWPF